MAEFHDERENHAPLSPEQAKIWDEITQFDPPNEINAIQSSLEKAYEAPKLHLDKMENPFFGGIHIETTNGNFMLVLKKWTPDQKTLHPDTKPLAKIYPVNQPQNAGISRNFIHDIPKYGKFVVLEGPSVGEYLSPLGPTQIAQGFNLAFRDVRTKELSEFEGGSDGRPPSPSKAQKLRDYYEHLKLLGLIQTDVDRFGKPVEVQLIWDDEDDLLWTPEVTQVRTDIFPSGYHGVPQFPESE